MDRYIKNHHCDISGIFRNEERGERVGGWVTYQRDQNGNNCLNNYFKRKKRMENYLQNEEEMILNLKFYF